MEIILCTGDQDTEEELDEFLKEHPEFDKNIFSDMELSQEDEKEK